MVAGKQPTVPSARGVGVTMTTRSSLGIGLFAVFVGLGSRLSMANLMRGPWKIC